LILPLSGWLPELVICTGVPRKWRSNGPIATASE
jgi:hypothetical protein